MGFISVFKGLNKLLNSWKEKISFITKHNYLQKVHLKNPVHKCTSWRQVVPRLQEVELTIRAHNIQLQSKFSGDIFNFVMKVEDKQCNNIASKCKKKISTF
jgi:hypothetical protein